MSVEEISTGSQQAAGNGKVFVVDPNPPNNETLPAEDMFIYVKFSAYPKSRTTYNGNGSLLFGVEDEVNFISTKIRYNGEGKIDPKPQNTYATTDWSEIGSFKSEDTVSSGVLEGFGIKSISIKYDASLVPKVDITFTDIRGSALFDVITNDDILSPYAVFFKMPYPTFRLTVKGYFGQSVDFCLHMFNWTSNFDGKTGNFDISANFLGFQQAFLNDMVVGNIIGTVNTYEGSNKLNQIFNSSKNDDLRKSSEGIRKLDDFFVKIANLNLESEKIKLDTDNFVLLKFLNGKIKLLKEIQDYVGNAIGKDINKQGNSDGTLIDYLKIKNNPTQISTDSIGDKVLELRKDYISIRDFILINVVNLNQYKSFIKSLNDAVKSYYDYITSVDTTKAKNSLEELKNKSKDNNKSKNESIGKVLNYIKPKQEDDQFIKLFNINNESDDWQKYLLNSQISNAPESITNNNFILKNVLEEMYTEKSPLGIYLKNNYENDKNGINSEFDINNFKTEVDNGSQYTPTMTSDKKVLVVDLREIRAILSKQIQDLEEVIKSQKEIVQKEINDELFDNFLKANKFLPNIENCFEIIANNTQAMVETVYEITQKSEEKSIAPSRKSIISRYDSDVPPSLLNNEQGGGVAWPTIYRKNADQSKEEVYIGELNGVNKQNFPEYDFVERVFENFVKKREKLQQITRDLKTGEDTDNWFPINPMDYSVNPFFDYKFYNDQTTVTENFIETTFKRTGVLLNYSKFDKSTGFDKISTYGKFDALIAYETLKFNNTKLLMVKKVLAELTSSNLFNNNTIKKSSYIKNNIDISSTIKFKDSFTFGGYTIGNDYIEFDNYDIINNSKRLIQGVLESDEYDKLTNINTGSSNIEEKSGELYYKNYYYSNNLTTNNIFNVWNIDVCTNLFKRNDSKIESLDKTKLEDINIPDTNGDGRYLNKTQFKPDATNGNYEDLLIGGDFYTQQNRYSKAFLLLSTFPFRDFESGFLKSITDTANTVFRGARVIKLPALYVYYIGGLLWRDSQTQDPLIWDNYTQFQTPKNEYLSKITYYGYNNPNKSTIPSKNIEESLLKLPQSVKNKFIQEFQTWTKTNAFKDWNASLGSFETFMDYYTNSAYGEELRKTGTEKVLEEVKKVKNLILFNPSIFDVDYNYDLTITNDKYNEYLTSFKGTFDKLVSDENLGDKDTEKEKKGKNNNNAIKLEIYNYFKNINNKWVTDTPSGKGFSICGDSTSSNRNLIDYFKFIDRGWRDIGQEVTINVKSFLSIGNEYNNSIYFFMSKVLRDNNFLFQILPTYINYKDANEVASIFKPQTNITNNNSTGPVFCAIYVGGTSEYLDIKERNNYHFNNDGWAFKNGQIPSDVLDNNKANASGVAKSSEDYSLVAFRVAFGAQNQTIFTDVSLSQQEHKETAEYFAVLSDEIDKRGATRPSYIGTNLLRMFKTRSYTCSVNALGCMNIQPLMYFDLQNVPFFNGAYLITNVDHQISPNHMTTSFKGLRQSKYQTKPTTDIVSSLDIDLSEAETTPILFFNTNARDGLFSIGLRDEIAANPFDFEQITQGNLELIGVPTSVITSIGDLQTNLALPIKNGELVTNSEVTMFLANVLANSNYFQNNNKDWGTNFQENEVEFELGPFSGETKKYENSSIEVVSGTDKKYFTYTPTTSGETDPSYNNTYAYYFTNTDEDLSEWNKVVFSGDKLTTKLSALTYYNIYQGDEYLYRPTGYLYMVGRKQYFDFYDSDGIKTPQNYYTGHTKSLEIALKVWKERKDPESTNKTPSLYSNEISVTGNKGSYSVFERTRIVSQQYKPIPHEDTVKIFKKILEVFYDKTDKKPLIDYANP